MQKEFENDLLSCWKLLKEDGIILYPTDTVWGLGCDATQEKAVQRIIALKKRPENKSFVVLVANLLQLEQYVGTVNKEVIAYLDKAPKPTTVIYPKADGLAPSVLAADGSVAIRICKDPFCLALLKGMGQPLLSTSANISGVPAPAIYVEIDQDIKNGVDYVVSYRQGDSHRASPSAIIKWGSKAPGSGQSELMVLRP